MTIKLRAQLFLHGGAIILVGLLSVWMLAARALV